MQGFTIVWVGQIVSQLGSAMSWFAFSIWAWQRTGQATTLALVEFFAYIPTLLFSPLAGVLVDRWNKKLVMVLSDLGAALATFCVLILYSTHLLQVWHLYAAAIFGGIFIAFQFPAYSAATILMLPKEQYSRAEGMLGLTQAVPGIIAPLLAAALLGKIGFGGIMIIDLVTFLAAFGALALIFIPRMRLEPLAQERNLWAETLTGFRYIFERAGLRALIFLFVAGNFFEGIGKAVMVPMILARTNNNAVLLGSVQSIGAFGGIIGGTVVSLWGGPRRRIIGITAGWICACGLGTLLMGLGSNWIVWATSFFFFTFFVVFVNSSEQALWQTKVNPSVQGRVAANRLLLIQLPYLISLPLAGWLADSIFEPAMAKNGNLSILNGIVGSGPGSGMSLLLILAGLGGILVVAGAYAFKTFRHVEDSLPDFEGNPPLPAETAVGTREPYGS
jgi:MFS transporter, DHA3 family, macrolide efflux protein